MTGSMSPLGLSEAEENLYRELLRTPDATAQEFARALGVSVGELRRLAGRLERLGLAIRTPQRPPRFQPVNPEIAISTLRALRSAELERAKSLIPELLAEFHTGQPPSQKRAHFVELVRGAEAIRTHYFSLLSSVRRTTAGLVTVPFMVADGCGEEESKRRHRGVTGRYIFDQAALGETGRLQELEEDTSEGDEIRVLDPLPMKLLLFDEETAFVPVAPPAAAAEPELLLIRTSRLLDGLVRLFELLWVQAAPFPPTDELATLAGEATETDREILRLMGAGLKDQAIARNLGLGVRTVHRRVRSLMVVLGAKTRFQAGLLASRRGWLG